MTRNLFRCAALLAALATSSGCATSGLSFFIDDRVAITSPSESDEVVLPLEIAWQARDVDGYFAVFLDRSPMRPGRDLVSLVASSDPCRSAEVCPDATWLAEHDVYVTDQTSLTIATLPDRRANNRAADRHTLTIVLLDENGRRMGESAFTKEFIVERDR
jgi:hypothetical protein